MAGQGRQRYREGENTAGSGRAGDRERPAHELDEAVADREAEPCAGFGRPAESGLLKRFEEPGLVGGGEPHTGIAHAEMQFVARPRHRQADLSAGGEFHRVAEQVLNDLPEFLGIADDRGRQIGRQRDREGEVLLGRAGADAGLDVPDQLRQVKGRGAQFHPAGLDLGEIEHLVDHAQEVFAAVAHDIEAFAVMGRELRRAHEDLRVADDAVERRAQFMAHVREEHALGAVGRLRVLLRHGQFTRALLHELLQPPLLPGGAAQPPAEEAEDAAKPEEHVEDARRRGAMPGRGNAEGDPVRRALAAGGVPRPDFEGEGAAFQVGECDLRVRRPVGPRLAVAAQAVLKDQVVERGEARSREGEGQRRAGEGQRERLRLGAGGE